MVRRIQCTSRFLATLTLVLGLGALPDRVGAEGWSGDDAAETTAGDLDDHEAQSENPDGLTTDSRNPDDMVVGSETMEGRVVGAEDPDSMVAAPGVLDQHEATSENLSDLPNVKPDAGYVEIEVPGQADWEPTTDPQVLLARQNLLRAEARARAAITTYGDAERRDYPRGQARVRIVEERNAAMAALEEAKARLADVQ
jgi:hypothetical protein